MKMSIFSVMVLLLDITEKTFAGRNSLRDGFTELGLWQHHTESFRNVWMTAEVLVSLAQE